MDIVDLTSDFTAWIDNLNLQLQKIQFRASAGRRSDVYETFADYLDEYTLRDTLKEQVHNAELIKDPSLPIFSEWLRRYEAGENFVDIGRGWLPEDELVQIAAASKATSNDSKFADMLAFQRAHFICSEKHKVMQQFSKALFYPLVCFVMIVLYIYGADKYLVPQFLRGKELSEIPEFSQYLFGTFRFLVDYRWLVLATTAAAFFFVYRSMVGEKSTVRDLCNGLPPFNIYQAICNQSFVITLASLLGGGMKIKDAIILIRDCSSPWVASHLDDMIVKIDTHFSGDSSDDRADAISAAMNAPFFRNFVRYRLYSYSRLSSFDRGLDKISGKITEYTNKSVSKITFWLGNALLLLNVSILLSIVYAVMLIVQQDFTL